MRTIIAAVTGVIMASTAITSVAAQATLDSIKQRGELICGSNTGLEGFGAPDAQGNWVGLDVDFCRALSATIFDGPNKVRFHPVATRDRFAVVQSGQVDVLARNATAIMSRDTQLGLDFPAINYFDGQGFMVRRKPGIASAKDLHGASICVRQGTTTEFNLTDYFRSNNLTYQPVLLGASDEPFTAYEAGQCDALTGDASALYAVRQRASNPEEHIILPEIISKEPLGPVIRQGDSQWADVVRWVHYAMLDAEELGVTRANVEQMLKSDNPEIKRLLGLEGKFGEGIGLTNDWAVRIIKHVGNYGESFERNVGEGSRLKIKRGQNALWTKGGLQYGLPVR